LTTNPEIKWVKGLRLRVRGKGGEVEMEEQLRDSLREGVSSSQSLSFHSLVEPSSPDTGNAWLRDSHTTEEVEN